MLWTDLDVRSGNGVILFDGWIYSPVSPPRIDFRGDSVDQRPAIGMTLVFAEFETVNFI